ncbi:hypothetical protein Efla_006488 [Eimeria flavescens]
MGPESTTTLRKRKMTSEAAAAAATLEAANSSPAAGGEDSAAPAAGGEDSAAPTAGGEDGAAPAAAATAAATAAGESKSEESSSLSKKPPREAEHTYGNSGNANSKERLARIAERRLRAEQRIRAKHKAANKPKKPSNALLEQHRLNKLSMDTEEAGTAASREEQTAEAAAELAEVEFGEAVKAAIIAFENVKDEFGKQRKILQEKAADKRRSAKEEDEQKTQERNNAEATVRKSIEYQRAEQAKRLATLPTLMPNSTASAPLCEASSARPAAAAAAAEHQVQQHQQQERRQQQLQQLEKLTQSVGLEAQLLDELKNLKLDEEALFTEDVRKKDQRFVNCMLEHKEELQATATLMNEEYAALRAQVESELKKLEEMMMAKRKEVLEEREIVEAREESRQYWKEQIQRKRIASQQQAAEIKSSHTARIEQLEMHLESVLATYQLNQEKLTYNVQLLEQRNAENAAALLGHRARHNQCREALTKIAAKFRAVREKYLQENLQGTAECRRLMKQYLELGRVLEQKSRANQALFERLWKHHEEEVGELCRRVVEADKLIHHRYLGCTYTAPEEGGIEKQLVLFGLTEEEGFDEASTLRGLSRNSSSSRQRSSSNRKNESLRSFLQRRSSNSSCTNEAEQRLFPTAKINKALFLLKQTCGFLLINQVRG